MYVLYSLFIFIIYVNNIIMENNKLKQKIVLGLIISLIFGILGCESTLDDIDKTDKNKSIEDFVSEMTLDEKIGQMIVVGFNGTDVSEELTNLVNINKVGGVILFKRNIETSQQLKELNNNIEGLNKEIPLFISVDEEGGRVNRLPSDMESFPSAREVGLKNNKDYAYNNGKSMGESLKVTGFNMNYAPVLDIFSNPQNTVIGDRAFGSDIETVSTMGISTMKGIEDEGIISVVKHFPGHGDTFVDSHYGLPIVYKSLKELDNFEFIPFKKAIEEGCKAIMVSHILLDKIDNKNPSSMSKTVITGILREKLGFDGVIITDDMEMKAITENYTIEDASVKSIIAGCDILLIGSGTEYVNKVIDAIKEAILNGHISEERIDESVTRIIKLKSEYLKFNLR